MDLLMNLVPVETEEEIPRGPSWLVGSVNSVLRSLSTSEKFEERGWTRGWTALFLVEGDPWLVSSLSLSLWKADLDSDVEDVVSLSGSDL